MANILRVEDQGASRFQGNNLAMPDPDQTAQVGPRHDAALSPEALAVSIVAYSNDAIIGKTLDGTVLSWNAAAQKIFGYAAEEMIGQPIKRLFPADRIDEEAELMAQVQAGGQVSHFETQRLRKDGALIDVSVTLSAIRGGDGCVAAVSKIARDITERKRLQAGAEIAMALQQGLDQSSLRIALWGPDERNLYANAPYAAEWGLTPAQLRGLHFSEVLEPAVYARAQPLADAARAGQPQLFQRQVASAAGVPRHELVNLIPGPGVGERRGLFIVITDITRQVQAEQAAAEAAARYQQQYEATPAMLHASAPDGRLLSVSNTWLKSLGYTRDEVLARHVPDFLTPRSREVRRLARLAMVETGVCENIPLEVICKSGRVMDVLMSAYFERDGDGQVLRVMTVLHDVTDRLRAERALVKSEALLNRTGALAGVGGWELDIGSERITWSEQTYRIHGVPADYIPALAGAIQFYAPEARDAIQTAVERAMATGEAWDLELPFIRANGERLWVRAVGAVEFEAGQPARLVGALQDISERKQLSLDLADQQRFLRRVMDMSPQGMFTTDLAGRCTYANAAWQALTGLSLAQALSADLRQFIHPDDLASVLARRQAALDGDGIQTGEHRYRRPDGRWIWVRGSLTLLQPGKPADGFVGTVEDVTERRELDAALAERSAELARSNEDLERFAYVASHDLQEPLRMVNSYGQLLLRRHGAALLPEAQEFLHFVVDGGQRAQLLIRDLLTLARLDSPGQTPRRQAVALDAVLAEALHALRDRLGESEATVTHDPLPTVMADAAQMGQLLDNLLSNALKFRSAAAPVIHVGAERRGAGWRISVSDNGIGVDPKYFDRIFVMFQRLHLRSEHEGTGIGLAICKKVVERHGGQIGLESQLGQGTCFFFTLPDPKREGDV